MSDVKNRRHCQGMTAFLFALAALVVVVVTLYSLHHGKLALPPNWDDCLYLIDGMSNALALRARPVSQFFVDYLSWPMHAPLFNGAVLTAFLVFGLKVWAPYLLLALPLFVLLWCSDRLVRHESRGFRFLIAAFVATTPLFLAGASELTPDFSYAIFSAGACSLLFLPGEEPRGHALTRRLGLLFAAAFLVKPTAAPMTATLFAISVWGMLYGWVPGSHSRRGVTEMVLIVLILILPHYLVALREMFQYLSSNIFGENSSPYRLVGSWWDHANYYLFGHGGWVYSGRNIVLYPLVGLAGVVEFKSRLSARKLALPALVTALFYLLPTIVSVKFPHWGLPLHVWLTLSVIALAAKLRRARHPRIRLLSVGLPILGLLFAVYSLLELQTVRDNPGFDLARTLPRTLIDYVQTHRENINDVTPVYVVNSPALNSFMLDWENQGRLKMQFMHNWRIERDLRNNGFLPHSFVFIPSAHFLGLEPGSIASRKARMIEDAIKKRGDFKQIGRIDGGNGEELRVYYK